MDAAAAAAMSDPLMNRWFRRRWLIADVATAAALTEQVKQVDQLDLTGRELLEAWRRERAAPGLHHAYADPSLPRIA